MKKLFLAVLILPTLSFAQSWPTSFSQAKSRAESEVYFDRLTTFYCGCDFVFDDTEDRDGDGNIKETMIYPQNCGYVPRKPITSSGKPNARASRIEWEHIMPASHFGGQLDQWQNHQNYEECETSSGKSIGGRQCAEKLVPWFKKAHDDMHNLTPAIGELNGDRSNYSFGEISGEKRNYGACDFEIDFDKDLAEPPDSVKGNIARVYLYMSQQHNEVELEPDVFQMMMFWDHHDPVDAWECERDKRIEASQGNSNPFVKNNCTH
ncbi:endonuclease [Planctobacterium marinum]|uniref:endonuclease n=1 Tax=Planctobacterium marinum TaxID=1631968 RepID=UPI001E318360|nr:endonuclease [Planctobacterium marinum]MCC2606587.1 endonuclease [Planctobacterium marinum]